MKVLVDVNVLLDVLLDRQPHFAASAAVWSAIETGAAEGLLAAHAVTAIHYLIRKEQGAAKARQTLTGILRVFGVALVDERVILEALEVHSPDFEDAVTAAAASLAGCDLIVTRDPKGFRGSRVRALAPNAAAPPGQPRLSAMRFRYVFRQYAVEFQPQEPQRACTLAPRP